MEADDRGSEWRSRYEASVADEERRLESDLGDPQLARAIRVRAYFTEATGVFGLFVASIMMITLGNAWLVIFGVVLLVVMLLAVAGLVQGWRRPHR